MNKSRRVWVIATVVYALFFSWYTSFGGPLTDVEIDRYMARISANPGSSPETIEMMRRFMEEDSGDDFVMINLIELHEQPLVIEGVRPGETSEEVLAKYMQYMSPALFSRASHPVLIGRAANQAMDLMNAPGMKHWTTGAAMRYRSRRDMLEITMNPEFRSSHQFKVAAMAKTIAFPIDPWFHLGDPRLLLALLLAFIAAALSRRSA